MKRTANILVATLASAFMLTGCVLGHDMKTDEPVELRCRPVMAPGTRAEEQSSHYVENLFPQTTNIGLWAYSLPRDKQWEIFAPDAKPFAKGLKFANNSQDGLWYPPVRFEWDYSDALTIVAYAPYEQEASFDQKRGLVVEGYDTEANHNVDLMYTEFLADRHCEKNRKGVDLPFHHALAAVDVRISTSLVIDNSIVIHGIYLEEIHSVGTFNSNPEPTWYTTTETRTVPLYEDYEKGWSLPRNNNEIIADGYRWLIPQLGTTRVVVVADVMLGGMITPDQEFVTEPINFIWEPGRHYTYSLNISAESLRVDEPKPEDHK